VPKSFIRSSPVFPSCFLVSEPCCGNFSLISPQFSHAIQTKKETNKCFESHPTRVPSIRFPPPSHHLSLSKIPSSNSCSSTIYKNSDQHRCYFINVLRVRFSYKIFGPKITKLYFSFETFWHQNFIRKTPA